MKGHEKQEKLQRQTKPLRMLKTKRRIILCKQNGKYEANWP